MKAFLNDERQPEGDFLHSWQEPIKFDGLLFLVSGCAQIFGQIVSIRVLSNTLNLLTLRPHFWLTSRGGELPYERGGDARRKF